MKDKPSAKNASQHLPRILITGASGFLGTNLAVFLRNMYTVIPHSHRTALQFTAENGVECDLSSERNIRMDLFKKRFDCVVHLAAVTSPDICEQDRTYAARINIEATQHIVNYANDNGTPVIFFSTDLVFDGKKGAYTESDAPNPVNYYGETKLLAEQSVLNALESNIVCRIALSYGKNAPEAKGGYLDKLLEGIQAGKKQFLFTDQYRTPLYSGDLCQATAILLEHMVHGNSGKVSRIFHLGGPDTLSRYQIGEQTAQIFGFSLQLLCPVTMADIQNKVQRGSDCSLSIDRAKHELGFVPRNMKECLHRDKQMREEKQKNGNFNRN